MLGRLCRLHCDGVKLGIVGDDGSACAKSFHIGVIQALELFVLDLAEHRALHLLEGTLHLVSLVGGHHEVVALIGLKDARELTHTQLERFGDNGLVETGLAVLWYEPNITTPPLTGLQRMPLRRP